MGNPLSLMKEKYYLYEPLLNIYEQYVGKSVEKTPSKKWLYVYYIYKMVEWIYDW